MGHELRKAEAVFPDQKAAQSEALERGTTLEDREDQLQNLVSIVARAAAEPQSTQERKSEAVGREGSIEKHAGNVEILQVREIDGVKAATDIDVRENVSLDPITSASDIEAQISQLATPGNCFKGESAAVEWSVRKAPESDPTNGQALDTFRKWAPTKQVV